MTQDITQFVLVLAIMTGLVVVLGKWMTHLFTSPGHNILERGTYRILGVDPEERMSWKHYGVVLLLSFIARHTRFGRYVYAIGGNPDAARLAGIPVRRVMIQLNLLLAALVALAAVVAMARLNAGTNSMGTGMELTVIAAAVIGGVSLAGGSGSVGGTVLGALIIQSIDSGLLLTDVSIGWRMVVLGQVLVAAVVFDRVVQK